MIKRVFFTTDGIVSIHDEDNCVIDTNKMNVKQAMEFAFNTKALFQFAINDKWLVRQCIKAFSELTNTKNILTYYTDLGLHIWGDLIKNFHFDMNNGFPQLLDTILIQEHQLANTVDDIYAINDNDVQDYLRSNIIEALYNHIPYSDNTSKDFIFKYIDLLKYEKDFNKIGNIVFKDKDKFDKSISWIDVTYCEHQNIMYLNAYNSAGYEIFSKQINNISKNEAHQTYDNIVIGMKLSDFYLD